MRTVYTHRPCTRVGVQRHPPRAFCARNMQATCVAVPVNKASATLPPHTRCTFDAMAAQCEQLPIHQCTLQFTCVFLHCTARTNIMEPFLTAVVQGEVCAVRALVASGADVNAHEGRALTLACQMGHTEVVHALLRGGVNIAAHGPAALWWGCEAGNEGAVHALLQAGAPTDSTGDKCLAMACLRHDGAIATALEKAGARPGARCVRVMHGALRQGRGSDGAALARLLLTHGAPCAASAETARLVVQAANWKQRERMVAHRVRRRACTRKRRIKRPESSSAQRPRVHD